ncbi:ABC transporter permease [Candidatus Saccharibacteria bacterium]|nr:ABC transporter permease [Candidatus Saccharibacteria bacterium]MBQ6375735.1 ABC transporter permease [Candidatus Saccharibacteria bacterium]
MSLLIRTHLRLARAAIRENRTRSFLTCLGIAIGIASIILILSLTGSISRLISGEIKDVGSNLIVVRPSTTKDTTTSIIEELTGSNSYEKSNLAISDVNLISKIADVTAATPIALSSNTITDDDNIVESATILGTTTNFTDIEPLTLKYGTFITDSNKSNSVVVGHMLSLLLFNTSNPVGRTLTFHDQRFIVVGVLDEITDTINFNNVDYNHAMILDLGVLNQLIGSTQIQQINVRVANTSALESTATSIKEALKDNHYGDTNFTVAYGDAITHPASNLLNIISGMLALVAGISLIVGGIGVMNIMLVSVAERTHEIGIRKAVGASARDILTQFMFESLILCFLGGFLGVVLGYILAFLVSIITPFTPYISWEIILITLGTSLAVGVIFGIYPAIKAASKDPIASLKHYR